MRVRGGFHDPFDPEGSDEAEPSGVAVIVWSGVAAVALLFAVVALVYSLPPSSVADVDPERFRRVEDLSREVVTLTPRSDFSMEEAAGEPDAGTDVSGLRVENAALRQSVAGLERRLSDISGRLADLEAKLDSVTGSLSARPPARPAPPGVGGPAPPADAAAELAPAAGPDVRRTPFGVELGAFDDLRSLTAAWMELTRAQPGLFDDLKPVATIRDAGSSAALLLVAGPFPTASDAAARCELARSAGVDCLPAFYVGQPLGLR